MCRHNFIAVIIVWNKVFSKCFHYSFTMKIFFIETPYRVDSLSTFCPIFWENIYITSSWQSNSLSLHSIKISKYKRLDDSHCTAMAVRQQPLLQYYNIQSSVYLTSLSNTHIRHLISKECSNVPGCFIHWDWDFIQWEQLLLPAHKYHVLLPSKTYRVNNESQLSKLPITWAFILNALHK